MDMSMRYAHCEGHTDLTYDDNGRYLITCGTDGDIRIFDGFEDDDPKTHNMGDTIHSLAFKNGMLYLSADNNNVSAYTFPDMSCDGMILQFFTAVFEITCSKTGKYVAAGGGDFIIKVYNTETKTFATCGVHEAPILSMAIDPEEKYLASSSCDGTVRITQLPDYSCVKVFSAIKKSNDFCNSETLCGLKWHPNKGKFLVVPVEMELKFYERDTWDCVFALQDQSIKEILSLTTFSPCGNYIAASANDGLVLVWSMHTKKCIGKKSHEKNHKICSLAWNPSGKKEIALCDVEGQLGVFDDFDSDNPYGEATMKSTAAVTSTSSLVKNDEPPSDDDDMNDILNYDDKIVDANDEDSALDIGAMKAKWEPKMFGKPVEELPVATTVVSVEPQLKPAPVTPLQVSFQPSSTPLHLDNRFMVWNTVGIVRCYNTEEENSIDVEFHDTSIYHPIHVNNIHNFTMAALSTEALLMASVKNDDGPSKLQCQHIGTWDSNKEWTIDMGEEEEIEAIALGNGWVAAVTSARLLRLFTISGVQCEIFCIPGPAVCLTASDMQLAIAYHRGPGLPEEQNMGLMMVNVSCKSRCICKDYALPLTAKSFVSWMGFTDEGQLCTVDTSGIVRLLNTIGGHSKWIPLADTKSHVKGKSDNYFVVGLSEIQQEIRCILCKGTRYPSMLPRPTVTVLPFSMPFCEMTTDKGSMEEEQQRSAILHARIKSLLLNGFDLDSEFATIERKWNDVLLKMFALATRSDREYRALDIAELMPTSRVVQGAIKYATQKHHMALAERLGEVVHKKIMEETSEVTNAETNDDEDESIVQSIPSSFNSLSRNKDSEEEVEQLRPKQLYRPKRSSSMKVDITEEPEPEDVEEEEPDCRISLLPDSSPMVNPFKVQSKSGAKASKENTNGIDDMLCETKRRLASKATPTTNVSDKKTSKQSKLFAKKEKPAAKVEESSPLAPKKFGFSLYLEENKEELKAENPDMEEGEIAKLAIKLFKELLTEEKEKYKSKPNSQKEVPTSKRKADVNSEGNGENKKTKKSDDKKDSTPSVINSFMKFAFVKKASEE